jgi:hypothetical protein
LRVPAAILHDNSPTGGVWLVNEPFHALSGLVDFQLREAALSVYSLY